MLDEPTASIDFGNQAKVMPQIRSLTAKGVEVLFTSHDPNQVMRYATRVALLGGGQLLAEGVPANVLHVEALSTLFGSNVRAVFQHDLTVFLPD